jgi:hypothetical protein
MSKSVTVKFADGTSHVYDDVPDDVTDQQVEERASGEFSKPIAAVNPPTPKQVAEQKFNEQSTMERIGGALAAGANLAGQALSHPVGLAIEGLGTAAYLGNKLAQRNAPTAAPGPVAPSQMPVPQTMPAQQAMTGTGSTLQVMPGGQAQPATTQMGRQFSPQAQQFMQSQAQPAPAAQPAPSPYGAKPGSVLDNASQIVRKLALSKIIPAAEVAQGLFYTSPEEIATLKAAEERRKRAGQPR